MKEGGKGAAVRWKDGTKVAVIGAGNLGRIMADRLSGRFDVVAVEKIPEVLDKLKNKRVRKSSDFADAKGCEIAIICVKPNDVGEAVRSLSPGSGMLVVSCAAGIPIKALRGFGAERVARIMPNINIRVGEGMIGYCGEEIGDLFSGLARCVRMGEGHISLVTAMSASGVAYVWYLTRVFYEHARGEGMADADARAIMGQVLKGCGEMLLKDGATIEELLSTVATPKGTTAAGLEHLEREGVARSLDGALSLTEERCRQIEEES